MNVFKVNDYVVYPGHGVGVIKAIETKTVFGSSQDFFVIRICNTTLLVPINNIDNTGLRPVISKREADEVIKILKRPIKQIRNSYRNCIDKLNSGNIYEIADVLCDIHLLETQKELTLSERRLLDKARDHLTKELSLAR